MSYCRLCRQSAKAENTIVPAKTLCDDFVLCLECPSAGMHSKLSDISATTMAAADAIEAARNIKSDLARLSPTKQFRILIWGSSPSSSNPILSKRNELRTELGKLGHHVFFSEDLVTSGPLNIQEALQTEVVDLVICIVSDFGPAGEAHELIPGMGKRALVWFDKRAETAFAGNGLVRTLVADGTKVEYYNDDFVKCCAIVKGSLYYVDSMVALDNMADYYSRKANSMKVSRRS